MRPQPLLLKLGAFGPSNAHHVAFASGAFTSRPFPLQRSSVCAVDTGITSCSHHDTSWMPRREVARRRICASAGMSTVQTPAHVSENFHTFVGFG
uniref:Serine hydroxymethyltransferase n=1 Tax=Ascaris lumbricoides TaxID=6252 RepID=A0A0M3HSU0_ASCLU